MSKTIPIKEIKKIQDLKNYFYYKREYRNYALVTLGLNTALRISDILRLKWGDVYNFRENKFYKYVSVVESKTKKNNKIAMNTSIISALNTYKEELPQISAEQYLIKSRNGVNRALTRNRAYTIISEAAKSLDIEGVISCHSLRKTFGYQAWKQGIPPALLMSIYNHSSIEITKIYLSIDQDDKDDVFYNLNL